MYKCILSEKEIEKSAFAFKGSVIWEIRKIPVCWEERGYEEERNFVKESILSSWGMALGIPNEDPSNVVEFIEWDFCEQGERGVRVGIQDITPHVKAIGSNLDGIVNGVVLNFEFLNFAPHCSGAKRACIKTIAIHEFGHVLGLEHERNREDTPNWCEKEDWVSVPEICIGPWDEDSIMNNYCRRSGGLAYGFLSEFDIYGIQAVYYPGRFSPECLENVDLTCN